MSHPGWLGVVLGAFAILLPNAWANVPLDRSIIYGPVSFNCEMHLAPELASIAGKINIMNAYAKYSIEKLPEGEGGGFSFTNSHTKQPHEYKEVMLNSAGGLWSQETWSSGEQQFDFLDVGFKHLERESNAVNGVFVNFALNHSDENLKIIFPAEREAQRRTLFQLRWRIHDAVMEKYRQTKKYLNNADMAHMQWSNGWSDNSDVFSLMKKIDIPPARMNWHDIYENLALTIQVTYFGRRDFFRPSVRGGLLSNFLPDMDIDDKLPFEFRILPERQREFSAAVYRRFQRETSCELMRYARFTPDISPEMHDRFLREVLKTARQRGVKTILASADAFTARLFRRYGFKVFAELPTNQSEATEYLTYLEVDSPEYRTIMREFDQSALQVKVER